MAQLDRLKEQIAYLKAVLALVLLSFGIGVVLVIVGVALDAARRAK